MWGAWSRAPNWSSICTTRPSPATPTPSKSSSAASARSSALTLSRPCVGSVTCCPRPTRTDDANQFLRSVGSAQVRRQAWAQQFPRGPPFPVGDRLDGDHPHHHRHRVVLALPQHGGAFVRSQARCVFAYAGGRSRCTGGSEREIPPIDRRTFVRTAAVGLVLAGDEARSGPHGRAILALTLGPRAAALAG